MKKMNIFDLSWCKFYLYDERHNLGFPLVGASISMTLFIGLFVVGLIIFPSTLGLYELPNLPFLPFGIGIGICISFFIYRHRNKEIRKKRISEYQKYKKEHPTESMIRFLLLIIIPIVVFITDIIVANIRYNMP